MKRPAFQPVAAPPASPRISPSLTPGTPPAVPYNAGPLAPLPTAPPAILFLSRRLDARAFPSHPGFDVPALFVDDRLYYQVTPAVYASFLAALAGRDEAVAAGKLAPMATAALAEALVTLAEARDYLDARYGADAVTVTLDALPGRCAELPAAPAMALGSERGNGGGRGTAAKVGAGTAKPAPWRTSTGAFSAN